MTNSPDAGSLPPSILRDSSELTIIDVETGERTGPISASTCRTLALSAGYSSSTQVNYQAARVFYSGTLDIDCPHPTSSQRIVGHIDFTCEMH